jgi:hypothetical protein
MEDENYNIIIEFEYIEKEIKQWKMHGLY